MRVLFVSGRERTYARNEVLLRAFRRFAQVDVVAPQAQPRSQWASSLAVASQAGRRLARASYDLLFVGFYGHLLVQMLHRLRHGPLLFDAFLSTYDTLCFDRKLFAPSSPPGRLAYWLDSASCAAASHVLLDTAHHVQYFAATFGLPRAHFTALPVGCSEDIYRFAPLCPARGVVEVLSYTTFLPLHGVETTLRCAALLKGRPIVFRLLGSGPTLGRMQQMAQELALDNVIFAPPVRPDALAQAIAAADICLGGHFGASDKAARVIPGKIYQMLAVGRPVIAADAPGNGELLRHGESAYLVPAADPAALAQAIAALADDAALRARLAAGGHAAYLAQASEIVITRRLLETVVRVLVQRDQ